MSELGDYYFFRSYEKVLKSSDIQTVTDINGWNWTGVITCNAENTSISDEAKYVRVVYNTTVKPMDLKKLFQGKKQLIRVDFSGFDTSDIEDMSEVFSGCSNLESVHFDDIDTSKVTTMSKMFYRCSQLTNVCFENIDLSNVTDMSHMFDGCYSLYEVDLSNQDLNNVTTMSYMFNNCQYLWTLNLGSISSGKLVDMGYMFKYCIYINDIDLSLINTSNVTTMAGLFEECHSLRSFAISDTSNVRYFSRMFYNCKSLKNLNLTGFNTRNATSMRSMFAGCNRLETVNLSSFVTDSVQNMEYMFSWCNLLTEIDLHNFYVSSGTTVSNMFDYCTFTHLRMPDIIDSVYVAQFPYQMYYEEDGEVVLVDKFEYNLEGLDLYKFYGLESISLNRENLSMFFDYENQFQLVVSTVPANIVISNYTYISSNKNVATVDQNGLITAIAPGRCNITVTAYNGMTAVCHVTVGKKYSDKFTVIWKDYDGTILETDEEVVEGSMPSYDGENPAREDDEDYKYTFKGWTPALSKVTSDIEYIASYRKRLKQGALEEYWPDGSTVGVRELTGGDSPDNALIITIGGTVNVTGMISVSSGYVEFVAEEGKNAVLSASSNFSSQYMFHDNASCNMTFTGVTLEGNHTAGSGLYLGSRTIATLNDCTVKDFSSYGICVSSGAAGVYLDGVTVTGCQNGVSSTGFVSLHDVTITENSNGYWNNCYDTRYYPRLSGRVIIAGNTNIDMDCAATHHTLLIEGPLSEDSDIRMSNIALSVGTVTLAMPYNSTEYSISESDAQAFHYVLTEAQEAGNAVTGDIRLDDVTGNVEFDIFFKSYIKGINSSAYSVAPLPREDELEIKTYTDDDGTYYLFLSGETQQVDVTISDGYVKGNDFAVKVNGSEVETTNFDENTVRFSFRVEDETEIRIDGVYPDCEFAQVYAKSLTLKGNIEVNFYTILPDEFIENNECPYALVNGKRIEINDSIKSGNYYKITYPVTAKEMNAVLELQIYDDQNENLPIMRWKNNDEGYVWENGYSYSARTYLDDTISDKTTDQALFDLAVAMCDYGSFSQRYFGYDMESYIEPSSAVEDMSEQIVQALSGYQKQTSGTCPGISLYASSLTLKSETKITHYFTITAGHDISEYTFMAFVPGESDPVELEPHRNGSYYFVEIKNIPAKDLDTNYPVTVSSDSGEYHIDYYCALSYCSGVENETDEKLADLMKAIYMYNQKANVYFENQ